MFFYVRMCKPKMVKCSQKIKTFPKIGNFSKVYLSQVYFCEMYPTCVSSKLCEFFLKMWKPVFKDKRMGHYGLPLAVEGDISIVSVVPQLGQPSGRLKAHNMGHLVSILGF